MLGIIFMTLACIFLDNSHHASFKLLVNQNIQLIRSPHSLLRLKGNVMHFSILQVSGGNTQTASYQINEQINGEIIGTCLESNPGTQIQKPSFPPSFSFSNTTNLYLNVYN